MPQNTVVIIGGGVTGLSAAYQLQQNCRKSGSSLDIIVIDREPRFGGKVGTEQLNGCLIETGPDSFMAQKPGCITLARELGMEDQLSGSLVKRFYMMHRSKLHQVPYELVSLVPSKPEALWKASFLSPLGKFRACLEGLVKHNNSLHDQSLFNFLSSRFGAEFTNRFAAPMMAGVHNGDPHCMSTAAIYPTYWKMVTEKGSMTRAIFERRMKAAASSRKPMAPFQTFTQGMGSLVTRLCEQLTDVSLVSNCKVTSVDRINNRWRIITEPQNDTGAINDIYADAVLLCTPAYITSTLISSSSKSLASQLNDISYASTAVVSLAYPRSETAFAEGSSGYLVPHSEPTFITGCTYSHTKWPNRAPEDVALFRFFIGYAKHDGMVREMSEQQLIDRTHQEACKLMGIKSELLFGRCHRWVCATPQYDVGHLQKVERIEHELYKLDGVFLAGAAYKGIGVPDCITQGRAQAEKISKFVGITPGKEGTS